MNLYLSQYTTIMGAKNRNSSGRQALVLWCETFMKPHHQTSSPNYKHVSKNLSSRYQQNIAELLWAIHLLYERPLLSQATWNGLNQW